jgi:hypothetical protein
MMQVEPWERLIAISFLYSKIRKMAELNAVNNGVAVLPENGNNGHRSLAAAVTEYLEETTLTKKPKTLAAYTTALTYFTEYCPKLFLEDI